MAKITFQVDRCKGCGLCVGACPKKLIRIARDRINQKGHHPAEITNPECLRGLRLLRHHVPRLRDYGGAIRKAGEFHGGQGTDEGQRGHCRGGHPWPAAGIISDIPSRRRRKWRPTWPRRMPKIGGVFLQAESEIAAINMVYGAAAAGHAGDDLLLQPGNLPEERGAFSYIAGSGSARVGGERAAGRPGPGRHSALPDRTTSRPPRAAATGTTT